MYRRKDKRVSLRLRSYLLITTNAGFNLHAYLRDMYCELRLMSDEVIPLDDFAYSADPIADYALDTMVHDFWASGVTEMTVIRNQVARITIDYRIAFMDHPSEGYRKYESIVPLVRVPTSYGRW